MWKEFISGILSGFTVNPFVKWTLAGLIGGFLILKVSHWWVKFRKRV